MLKRLFPTAAPSIGRRKNHELSIANILCPKCALLLEAFLSIQMKICTCRPFFSHAPTFVACVGRWMLASFLRMLFAVVANASKVSFCAEKKKGKENYTSFFTIKFFLTWMLKIQTICDPFNRFLFVCCIW